MNHGRFGSYALGLWEHSWPQPMGMCLPTLKAIISIQVYSKISFTCHQHFFYHAGKLRISFIIKVSNLSWKTSPFLLGWRESYWVNSKNTRKDTCDFQTMYFSTYRWHIYYIYYIYLYINIYIIYYI